MIAILLIYIILILMLNSFLGWLPFGKLLSFAIATFFTLIIGIIYYIIKKAQRTPKEERNGTDNQKKPKRNRSFINFSNETEEERKARVNAEVDKIIEEQRKNKGQSK